MKAFKDCDLIVDDNDLLVLQETDPNQDPSKSATTPCFAAVQEKLNSGGNETNKIKT